MTGERKPYAPIYDPETQIAVGDWESEGNVPGGSVLAQVSAVEPIREGQVTDLGLGHKPVTGNESLKRAVDVSGSSTSEANPNNS